MAETLPGLTPSLKVKRNIAGQKYRQLIDSLCEEDGEKETPTL